MDHLSKGDQALGRTGTEEAPDFRDRKQSFEKPLAVVFPCPIPNWKSADGAHRLRSGTVDTLSGGLAVLSEAAGAFCAGRWESFKDKEMLGHWPVVFCWE